MYDLRIAFVYRDCGSLARVWSLYVPHRSLEDNKCVASLRLTQAMTKVCWVSSCCHGARQLLHNSQLFAMRRPSNRCLACQTRRHPLPELLFQPRSLEATSLNLDFALPFSFHFYLSVPFCIIFEENLAS